MRITVLLSMMVLSMRISNCLRMPIRFTSRNKGKSLGCIGTERSPVPPSDENENQFYVHSAPTSIIPIARELPLKRPSLITFDAFGTLIRPSQSIGRWYREVLNTHCDMRIRLPRPKLFTTAFTKAYSDKAKSHPCFGANSGITAKEWWFDVVRETYRTTENLRTIAPEELDQILPEVFETLYTEVFSTSKGWTVMDDVVYTLDKLRGWRDEGAGPKIGLISNTDDRLHGILADLGLSGYFDIILTSYESRSEKPSRLMFDNAISATGADPSTAYHVGDSVSTDISGAVSAGWTGLRFREWFDEDLPDWSSTESEAEAEEGAMKRQELMLWGRRDKENGLEWVELWGLDDILTVFGFPEDDAKPIRTTYIRGFLDD